MSTLVKREPGDQWTAALKAIEMVTKAPEGNGKLVCPKCGGSLHYTRTAGNTRKGRHQFFAFKCETENCLEGRGH